MCLSPNANPNECCVFQFHKQPATTTQSVDNSGSNPAKGGLTDSSWTLTAPIRLLEVDSNTLVWPSLHDRFDIIVSSLTFTALSYRAINYLVNASSFTFSATADKYYSQRLASGTKRDVFTRTLEPKPPHVGLSLAGKYITTIRTAAGPLFWCSIRAIFRRSKTIRKFNN